VMVPCGIEAVTMTSIAREVGGNSADMSRVESAVIAALASAFKLTARDVGRIAGVSSVDERESAARSAD
jgi:lipoate-protein ligase B